MQKLSIVGDAELLTAAVSYSSGVKTEKNGDTIMFSASSTQDMEHLKNSLTHGVSGIITEKYGRRYLEKAIAERCSHISPCQRIGIVKAAERLVTPESRRDLVESAVAEYLRCADCMCIEGFVNFRLHKYKRSLDEAAQKAVNTFFAESEYAELIDLLKCFVDLRDPREPLLHIICSGSAYAIYNERLKEITKRCIEEFSDCISEGGMSFDDLLISTLITLAPLQIIFHKSARSAKKELYETVESIFGDAVSYCMGCPLCENTHKH